MLPSSYLALSAAPRLEPASPSAYRPDVAHPPRLCASSDPGVIVSSAGIIHVLGYTPSEGEGGTPITVRIDFHPDHTKEMYLRLVIGNKAVATAVREINDKSQGHWQLNAVAPPYDQHQSPSKVLISVQALNVENAILDSAVFGEFSYWAPGASSVERSDSTPVYSTGKPKLQINTSTRISEGRIYRRRASTQLPTPSPTSPGISRGLDTRAAKPEIHLHRRTKAESSTRPRHSENRMEFHAQTPILDLVTNLESICTGWSASELHAGRRLVRFTKVQDGRRLIVSCEPVKVEDYHESDSVISCIYRKESDACFVTSVDIIFLLERLTSSDFPVEEKNRIRRNLEGLRPLTVSKHKAGFESFFQRIMEFPDPKPRNIEKDLKVFEWSSLDQALEKILSKYTIDTSPMADLSSSSAVPSPAMVSDNDSPLEYPVKVEDSYMDLAASVVKFEPLIDDFRFMVPSDPSEQYYSPAEASSSTTQPPLSSEISSTRVSGLSPGSWGSEHKPSDIGISDFGSYEGAVQPAGPFINIADYDFNPYEALAFHGISGDALAGVADHYI